MPLTADHIERFSGTVLTPGSDGYDGARRIFNGAIDRRPGLIAQARDATDVAAAVAHARGHDMSIAVRAGGHSGAGYGVVDDGLVVDVRPMQRADVDPGAAHRPRRRRPDLGASWTRATQAHGLAVTGGRISDTGVAGLTLGSGSGWLERMHGLTADNLLGADGGHRRRPDRARQRVGAPRPVLGPARRRRQLRRGHRVRARAAPGGADGVRRHAGVRVGARRGGAGGLPRHHARRARRARRLRGAAARPARAVRPARTWSGARCSTSWWPPSATWTERRTGRPAALPRAGGRRGRPDAYVALQSMLDEGNPAGMQNYWKAGFLDDLPYAGHQRRAWRWPRCVPSPMTVVLIQPLGGAYARV